MKVRVTKWEVHESSADIFLKDEDGSLLAIFFKGQEELADRIATFLNAPPEEELRHRLHAEHTLRLKHLLAAHVAGFTAGVLEHLRSVQAMRYGVNKDCIACHALSGGTD